MAIDSLTILEVVYHSFEVNFWVISVFRQDYDYNLSIRKVQHNKVNFLIIPTWHLQMKCNLHYPENIDKY